jgi:hypothetical protein
MANRKSQQLINYHSPGPLSSHQPSSSDVQYGEILVIHNQTEPLLGIKVNSAGTNSDFAWFISSAAVASAIATVDGGATDALNKVLALSGSVTGFSASVISTYATSSNTVAAINSAIEGLDSGPFNGTSAKTITKVQEVNGKLTTVEFSPIFIEQSQVNGLPTIASDVATNTSNITKLTTGLSATVVSSYATKSQVSAHVNTEIQKLDVSNISGFGAGKTLKTLTETDGKIAATFQDIEIAQSKVTGLESRLSDIDETLVTHTTNIGAVSGSLVALSSSVITTLSTVYHVMGTKGSKSDLPTTGQKTGDVWNVTNAEGTPGTTGYTPAGTNYVWDGTKWDALGGTVDLTNYATSANTYNAIKAVADDLSGHITGNFKTLSGNVFTLSGQVVTKYATSANTVNAINAKVNALDFGPLSAETVSGFVISAIKQVDGKIDAVKSKLRIDTSQIDGYSAVTSDIAKLRSDLNAVSAVTKTALQQYKLNTISGTGGNITQQSGAKATYDNSTNIATLDLSGLIIDCGDF